jgi:riboflavin synthase
MFSGIVDHTGTIVAIEQRPNAIRALIESKFAGLTAGESIAVDGICLTVTDIQGLHFHCDISPETLNVTTARRFIPGYKVNLERALRMGDVIGGHWVNGHVDQRAKITNKVARDQFLELEIGDIAPENKPLLVKKGSIAINGVSLTLNEILPNGFRVLLIPHTLERTNLSALNISDAVNLEFDCMTRAVVNYLQQLSISTTLV